MILPEHLNFILCVLSGLVFTSPLGAAEDLVFMKTWPSGGGRAIYQMPLLVNGSDPTSADTIHYSDDVSDHGFVYNYKTRSVLWSEGKEVRSLNIDDDSITTLVDASVTFSQLSSVTDLGFDGYGNIYFAAVDTSTRGFIGKIDTSTTVTQLYQGSTTNQVFNAISVDPIGQSVFGALKPLSIAVTYIKRLEGSTLTNIIITSETITSIAVDIYEQNVYYSDGVKIFYTNYTTPNGQNELYQETFASSITDLDVAGDYVYYVGSNNLNVTRINKDGSTGVTRIGPDVVGMNWIDVVLASESVLPCATTGIPHATLSATCYPLPGVSCDYTCDYGYEKNPLGAILTCGDNTGLWDLSTPCRAIDNFILVRQQGNLGSQRDIIMIPLNESGSSEAIKVVDLPDNAVSGGIVFDGFRRSILYSLLGVIYSVNIDDGSETFLVDLSASGDLQINRVTSLALDTASGDVYFAGFKPALYGSPQKKGSIGVVDTNGVVTELYHTVDTFMDMTIDYIHRFLFSLILAAGSVYNIVKLDFNGSNVEVLKSGITSTTYCIAVDITAEKVLWSDGYSNIYMIGYDGSNEATFSSIPSGGAAIDMNIVGDYIYYVGGTSVKITKLHRLDASNVTEFEPTNGLQYMYFMDVPTVFGSAITSCSVADLGNTTLPENCTQLGGLCNMFDIQCGYGFKKNSTIVYLICSSSGLWNVQLPTLCHEIICSSDSIDNATDTCTAKVGETCDTLTCNYGYHRNPDVGSLNCTESGDWNYNHSSICLETVCDRQIPNGNLSDACGIQVGDSCDTFTCDYGYNKTDGVGSFNCSEDGIWDYNMSVLCFVPKTVSATTTSVITHAKATKPVDPTTLKDTGFASGPTSSMTEDISTSTTSTVTTVPVSQSTTQQCGSVRGSLLDEPVFLVSAGMIAGAILSLSGAVLTAIIKRCITRNNFERTHVAPMNSVTEA